jgi:uncharacterized protein (TIGR02145 family)
MKSYTLWRNILLTGILLLLSCEEERDSQYPKIMQGQVDFSIPEPAVVGRDVLFQVSNGISDPENLTFNWSAPDFTPATGTGNGFSTTAPATPGIYPVFLTVRAAGYRDIVIKNEIRLEDYRCSPMVGSLRIEGPSNAYMNEELVFTAAGITSPAEPDVEYRWSSSGGFTPGTFTGKEFHTRIGDTPNTYTLYLEAIDLTGNHCAADTSLKVSNTCTPMTGALEFAAEPTGYVVAKGSYVYLTAGGIQTPSSGVEYLWSLPGLTGITYDSDDHSRVHGSFLADVYGERDFTVTAQASGYCPVDKTHTLKIVDCIPMEGQLKLALEGTQDPTTGAFRQGTPLTASASGITTPDNVIYEWSSPGISGATPTANTWKATLPSTVDSYVLTVTAKKPAGSPINYCEARKDTTISVGTVRMAGDLYIEASGEAVSGYTLRPGALALFAAKGISNPTVQNITYRWTVTGLTVSPYTTTGNNTWSFTVPSDATDGTGYSVQVIAEATGYTSEQVTITGTVKNAAMAGDLQLTATGDGAGTNNEGKSTLRPGTEVTFKAEGITAPTSLTYTWDWRISGSNTSLNNVTSPDNTWRITAPALTTDKYVATVHVDAVGYARKTKSMEFIIDNTTMSGNPQIHAIGNAEEVTETGEKITVRPGAAVAFNASGVTAPANVTYEWSWEGSPLTSGSSTGETWNIQVPNNAASGNYTIVLTARADGYNPKVVKKLVVVAAAPMSGDLKIRVNGLLSSVPDTIRPGMEISFEAEGITKPASNLTYDWEWTDGQSSATASGVDNKTWTITAAAEGHYTVKVTVKSYGYESKFNSKVIIVKAPEMAGDLTVKASDAGGVINGNILKPAANVTFSVSGVTNPATGVKYDWTVQDASATTTYPDNGKTLDLAIPAGATGSYTVTVTATATGYTPLAGAPRTFTVKAPQMTGDLTVKATGDGVNGDNTLRPAANVTFAVSGVTNPATGVTYTWTVQNNSATAETFTHNSTEQAFSIPAGATGNYTVTVTATATGYAPLTGASRTFTVKAAPMTGNIAIAVTGDGVTNDANGTIIRPKSKVTFTIQNSITQPADGFTYQWAVEKQHFADPDITGVQSAATSTTWVVDVMPDVTTGTQYTIKATAVRVGYEPKESIVTIIVKPATLAGNLQIEVTSAAKNYNSESIRPGAQADFTATGLTNPPAGISYEWTWKPSGGGSTPATTTENTWSTNLGAATGPGTITVTVKATGYESVSQNKTVTVEKGKLRGTLAIATGSSSPAANGDGSYRPNSQVEFTATGLNTPPTPTSYEWTWTLNDGTLVSSTTTAVNAWSANLGATASTGTIAVTAKLDGYTAATATKQVTVQNSTMRGTLSIVPTSTGGGVRTENGTLLLRRESVVRFSASMTNPPAGVTYDWEIKNNGGGGATVNVSGEYYDYTAMLLNSNSERIGDLVNIKLTAKANGYADKVSAIDANIRCFEFEYSNSSISYTSGGGSTIYTGSEVHFIAPITNPSSANYAWTSTTNEHGTGQQWTTRAPDTPGASFGASVTINQTGYCPDTMSLSGLSVSCSPMTGILTVEETGKPADVIYFNKNKDLPLTATYNGTAPDSYRWEINDVNFTAQTTTGRDNTITIANAASITVGASTLTVTAMKGACKLQSTTKTIIISDCPYTGSDLLLDATHKCEVITTNSTSYTQAYIQANGGQIYRIVQLPTTYPATGYLWWFAESSRLGTPTYTNAGTNYYIQTNAGNACPINWGVPSPNQWNGMFDATTTNVNVTALCSPDYNNGTDLWGFSATNTHYYRNNNAFDGDEGAYIWTTTTNQYVRIRHGNTPENTTNPNVYAATVRCVRQ